MRFPCFLFLLCSLAGAPAWSETALPHLSVKACLNMAFEHNEALIRAQQRLAELDYDQMGLRSRFLPTISLEGQYNLPERNEPATRLLNDEAVLRVRQRVQEFGSDNRDEVNQRAQQRQAILEYDMLARQVQSDIRRYYFLAVLKAQQILSREAVLASVKEKLHRIRVKYARGVAKEFDLLTAQLDSLEQEGKIAALLRDRQGHVAHLLQLTGMDQGVEVALIDASQPFDLSIDAAVDYALRQDVELKAFKTDLAEARRAYRETDFAYFPDVGFEVGLKSGDVVMGFDLSKNAGTRMWQLDFSSDVLLSQTGEFPLDARFDERNAGRFAAFQFTVPIFEGFQRRAQADAAKARMHQADAAVADQAALVEQDVRARYQVLQERIRQRGIDAQRLEIARRRLEIQERLRDLGLVTDNQVETFRDQFFQAQDRLFQSQDAHIVALEDLRKAMGYFE